MRQKSLHAIWAVLAMGALCFTPAVWSIKDPTGVKQERDQVREEIKQITEDIQNTTNERTKVEKLIELLEKRLEQNKDRLASLDKDRKSLEADIADLSQQEKNQEEALKATEERLGDVLRNQYRRQDINPTQAWLAGQSASKAARESYWYERISIAERDLAKAQAEQTAKLKETREGLETRQFRLEKTIAKQAQRERELKSQRAERTELVADLNSRLKDQELKKQRLERDEKRLSQLVEDLTRAIEEARRKQSQQPKRSTDKRTPQPNLPPVPDTGDFAKLKGRLSLPTDGTVAGKFGQTRDPASGGPSWKGIFIEAIEGQAVKAVGSGRVVFSEWLRGFGEIVIIDHGDQYLSVYGNNDKLLKSAGDNVQRGEKIAEVGNSSGNLSTGLYFELRHQGKPFDPLSWAP